MSELLGDGDADVFDRRDGTSPEVGLALSVIEVELDLTSSQKMSGKHGLGVIRLNMYFPDVLGDVLVCRFALQSSLQRLFPGIINNTFKTRRAEYMRMYLDVQRGVTLTVKTDTHTCVGSHGKTLSVEGGRPDEASKPLHGGTCKHKPLAKCGKFCYNIYILSPFSWGIMKPIL